MTIYCSIQELENEFINGGKFDIQTSGHSHFLACITKQNMSKPMCVFHYGLFETN